MSKESAGVFPKKTYTKACESKDGVIDVKALFKGRDKALEQLYDAMVVFYHVRCRKNRSRNKKVALSEKEFDKIQWAVENARRYLGAIPMLGFDAIFALRDQDDDPTGS